MSESAVPPPPPPPPAPPARRGAVRWAVLAAALAAAGGVVAAVLVHQGGERRPLDDIGATTPAAEPITLVAPDELGGQPKMNDGEFQAVVEAMKSGLQMAVPGATSAVAGAYGTPDAQDNVAVLAVTAPLADPERELDKALAKLEGLGVTVSGVRAVSPGPLGGAAKCGEAVDQDVPLTVCTWADQGSLGAVVFYFAEVDEVVDEFTQIRGKIETR